MMNLELAAFVNFLSLVAFFRLNIFIAADNTCKIANFGGPTPDGLKCCGLFDILHYNAIVTAIDDISELLLLLLLLLLYINLPGSFKCY